ncbi:MAG: hypothetical protein HKN37_04920 [Rhodothermales bacterium]|nr:hypothetical protein [Rhodothermales bacterium]
MRLFIWCGNRCTIAAVVAAALVVFGTLSVRAQTPTPESAAPSLPLQVPDDEWQPLREGLDAQLQSALEARLQGARGA